MNAGARSSVVGMEREWEGSVEDVGKCNECCLRSREIKK
jgi:hypothetical protein